MSFSPNLFTVRKIIWFAMVVSVLLYCLVIYFILRGKEPVELSDGLFHFFIVASAPAFLASILVNNFGKRAAKKTTNFQKKFFIFEHLSWALAQAICLFGFVLSILSYELKYVIYFSIPTLFLLLILRPLNPIHLEGRSIDKSQHGTSSTDIG